MSRVCLVVIFNHRFEKNIEKLRKVYKRRFSNVMFVLPFYQSKDPDVYTAYEASYFFQNHINQAFHNFDTDAYDHYVFIGDDLVLNPALNENNIIGELKIGRDEGYMKEIMPFDKVHHLWADKFNITTVFSNPGFDYTGQLPNLAEQLQVMQRYRVGFKKQTLKNLLSRKAKFSVLQLARYKNLPVSVYRLLKGYRPPIPLVTSYADFFVVPRSAMKQFTHICGVYGALNLWVEAAIPTALLLSCDKVLTEGSSSAWYGTEIWGKKNKIQFEANIKTYNDLKGRFKASELYIHPVKLSKITVHE
jgi:hypothetical protein